MLPLEVKQLNRTPIGDDSNDELLQSLILFYKGIAEEYCNKVFVEPYPFGVRKFIAESIKYGTSGNISSRSMGTVSYSFVTDLPKSTYRHLRPLRQLRW
ncbi:MULTISPECIES: phage head-tail connector protein [Staphylococcus intermedius group]|uniref:Putative phage DNA-packaging protein n=1 Tax=Staphylococcus intermedius NCTC 11048 TaxID=1141106 RepID=A0A380GAD9_STAIN|nr:MULTISPECIES: phage head-tail connector protein [Staphylococcus intermedius group]HBB6315876.1 phage head-tail connector protein [Escherichia coli]PCF88603.1 phage head-tail adapter protein [Staphylococcus intermedius]PNZ49102.1 phage head-tail adapter protein [Staphylococcus intermedius NCTC 11048]UXS20865.1 phage head-tail connector protein [Staphylococcus delphini]SUM47253.1 putative phage DNA-packaging protein [Staphylococcus intermedius NCTC 11048]